MISKRFLIVLPVFLLLHASGVAQLKRAAVPASVTYGLNSDSVGTVVFEKPRWQEPRGKSGREGPTALYAGTIIPFPADAMEKGYWQTTPGGTSVWRLEVAVTGVDQINFYFAPFRLLKDDLLFIYPAERPVGKALGPDNNGDYLATEIVNSNKVVLELDRHSGSKDLPFIITGTGVLKPQEERDFGGADYCEIPVNCSEGAAFQNQKNGVARVFVKEGSGLYWCTGTLVNNTRNDGEGLFLTANHCGENATAIDYGQWVFYFNYESEDCSRPTTEPEIHAVSGARLLAKATNSTSTGSDFKLLRLLQPVPKEYKPFFNGWDRTGDISSSGVTIHHPQGDIKMISTYTAPLVPGDYYGSSSNSDGLYWKVTWGDTENGHGVTEGGSSGSPLFGQDGLVIGSLTGGDASCSQSTAPDYYGRFWASWSPEGSDSSGQLAYWLDPLNLQPEKLNGFNPYAGEAVAAFSATVTQLPEGGKTLFKNLSSGNITAYRWQFSGGDPETSDLKNPPPVTYYEKGSYDVELTITYDGGTKTVTRKDYIRVMLSVYPNPSATGIFHIRTGYYDKSQTEVRVFDDTGRETGIFPPRFNDGEIVIDLSNHKRGLYFVRIDDGEKVVKYKMLSVKSE